MFSGFPDAGLSWATSTLLLSLRLSAILLMTPVLHAFGVPVTVRVLLVLGLSAVISAGYTFPSSMLPADLGSLLQAAVREIALGATLALGILLAFGAFAVAGRLLDVQIGFGIAQVFDPLTQTQVPIFTSIFNLVAALVFFLVDGHHALLRAVAYSLEQFPLGHPWPLREAIGPVLKQAGGLFALGFALAAPVVFCLFLVELALGVVARNLPQMNMLVLGIPVKIIAGLLALTLWFGGMGTAMNRAYAGIFQMWGEIFSLQAPAVPGPGRLR